MSPSCHPRISQDFMQPEGSLLCLQELYTGPYPQPHQSNPYNLILSHQDTSKYFPPTYVLVFPDRYEICFTPRPLYSRRNNPMSALHARLDVFQNLVAGGRSMSAPPQEIEAKFRLKFSLYSCRCIQYILTGVHKI
jgi:hypothetical protein